MKRTSNVEPRDRRPLVTFELTKEAFETLRREAERRGASSHHQFAREIVYDFLTGRDADELRLLLGDLDANVASIGDLVRRTAYSVMVHAAKLDSDAANAWILDNMFNTTKRTD